MRLTPLHSRNARCGFTKVASSEQVRLKVQDLVTCETENGCSNSTDIPLVAAQKYSHQRLSFGGLFWDSFIVFLVVVEGLRRRGALFRMSFGSTNGTFVTNLACVQRASSQTTS
jgi:hypothetical protein